MIHGFHLLVWATRTAEANGGRKGYGEIAVLNVWSRLPEINLATWKPGTNFLGADEETVRAYIQKQSEEDKRLDQLNLF